MARSGCSPRRHCRHKHQLGEARQKGRAPRAWRRARYSGRGLGHLKFMRIEVTTAAFDPIAVLADFEAANLLAGATASFVGRCRPESNGIAVERLELEHYPGFTEATIAAYANDLATRL